MAKGGDFRGPFNHARMLAGSGRVDEALAWIEQAGALGNDRFAAQVADWLEASDIPRLASEGPVALRRGTHARRYSRPS